MSENVECRKIDRQKTRASGSLMMSVVQAYILNMKPSPSTERKRPSGRMDGAWKQFHVSRRDGRHPWKKVVSRLPVDLGRVETEDYIAFLPSHIVKRYVLTRVEARQSWKERQKERRMLVGIITKQETQKCQTLSTSRNKTPIAMLEKSLYPLPSPLSCQYPQ